MEILKTYSVTDDTLNGQINAIKLQTEIQDCNAVLNFKSINVLGDTFQIIGASVTDENLLNTTVASHEHISLSEYKAQRFTEIDEKTKELILQGFLYNGQIFSLSLNAQINIEALHSSRLDPLLTYPITYNTLDDLEVYSIIDAEDLHLMYFTALGTKKSYVDSGTGLKNSIREAQTIAEVQAITDPR